MQKGRCSNLYRVDEHRAVRVAEGLHRVDQTHSFRLTALDFRYCRAVCLLGFVCLLAGVRLCARAQAGECLRQSSCKRSVCGKRGDTIREFGYRSEEHREQVVDQLQLREEVVLVVPLVAERYLRGWCGMCKMSTCPSRVTRVSPHVALTTPRFPLACRGAERDGQSTSVAARPKNLSRMGRRGNRRGRKREGRR